MKEHVTSLYSYDFIAKETEPLSSEEEINLLIQESLQSDSEVQLNSYNLNPLEVWEFVRIR